MSHGQGPGRPPKPQEDRRDALLKVRVRHEEKADVERAAFQAGTSVSNFVRQAITRAAQEGGYSMK